MNKLKYKQTDAHTMMDYTRMNWLYLRDKQMKNGVDDYCGNDNENDRGDYDDDDDDDSVDDDDDGGE